MTMTTIDEILGPPAQAPTLREIADYATFVAQTCPSEQAGFAADQIESYIEEAMRLAGIA